MRCALLLWVFVVLSGCAALPRGETLPKPASSALDPGTDTPLHESFAPLATAHPEDSGFRMLTAGVAGLTARLEMIDAARRTLDLQYYIFRSDASGNLLAAALLRAAQRGVRIRLLLDDGETVPGDERILSLAAAPGIEVRIFNPLRYRGHNRLLRAAEFLLEKARLDYRMHDKLLVADNAAAIIGGRNVGDQYFQIDPESQFGDDDLVVAGPMVPRLSGVFDAFWNGELAVPAQYMDTRHTTAAALAAFRSMLAEHPMPVGAALADSPAPAADARPFADILAGRTPLLWCRASLAYDSPDKKDVADGHAPGRLIYKAVLQAAREVHGELLVITPYFIPSPDELGVLEAGRGKGVHVGILTNSLDAAPNLAAQSGYMHYRPELLRAGAALYEVRALLGNPRGSGQARAISRRGNYGLHGKLYVFDRRRLFVGSMNYDQRSKHLNTEIGLIVDSAELAGEVANRFAALTSPDDSYALSLAEGPSGKSDALLWTTRENGKVVVYHVEPTRDPWRRIKVRLLSLLHIDEEL